MEIFWALLVFEIDLAKCSSDHVPGGLLAYSGIVNLLVATAPLLKTLPHAVLLTSLMASLLNLHRYKDMANFQEKLLCMSPQAAGILLGE